jgi:hypothetical protein
VDLDPGNLFTSIMVGLVGVALLMWGRSQTRLAHMVAGVLLVGLTFVVSGWPYLLLAAAGIIAALVLAVRAGC